MIHMSTLNASDIRTWAQQQGLTVSDRGRLPQDVVAAYKRAHPDATAVQAPAKAAKAISSTSSRRTKSPATAPARAMATSAASQATPARADDGMLEKRVAELEKQVLSLTERLDAAVTALTKRSRSFSLPKRK